MLVQGQFNDPPERSNPQPKPNVAGGGRACPASAKREHMAEAPEYDLYAHFSIFPRGGTMTKNVGNIERVIRIIIGLALLSLIYFLEGNARWWGLIGLGPILTAAVGYCPPYAWLGISTRPKDGVASPK